MIRTPAELQLVKFCDQVIFVGPRERADQRRDGFRLAWGNGLRRAVDHLTILDEALDEPVTRAAAQGTSVDTALAKVEVAVVADAAVIMFVAY